MKSKILTMLLSLVAAFILWAYVVSVEAPESVKTYQNVPVVLDGKSALEDRDLILVGKKDFKVDLTLTGYRTDLNQLSSSNITVLVDLSQITTAGTHELNYTISYPGGIKTGAIDTKQQDPQYVTVTVAERDTAEVSVVTYFDGVVPPNYSVDRQNVRLDHSTITVSGPKDVISKIAEARVDIDLEGRNQTFTEPYAFVLCDSRGQPLEGLEEVTTNVASVRATVRVVKMKEVPLKLQVIAGGGLTEDMIQIEYSQPSIIVSGSEKDLETFTEVNLGTLDLSTVTESGTFDYTITLPLGIDNVTGITAVSVSITIPQMETVTITIQASDIEALHVPEGMTVEFHTAELTISIRGPKELIALVRPENIVAVVDFANANLGSGDIYYVDIEIQGIEGVGAVGVYPVSVKVVAQEAAEA